MEPNFHALQLIAEIAIGIVGFSAILIALSRSSDVFSGPDNFRVRLLTYSAFCSICFDAKLDNVDSIARSSFFKNVLCGYLFI